MKYFDDHSLPFRVLFGAAAVLLLVLAGSNLHHSATYQTDENLFLSSPSSLYVTQSFPAQQFSRENEQHQTETLSEDSVLIGDFLLAINGQECESLADVQHALEGLDANAELELRVLRTAKNRRRVFHINKAALPENFLREISSSVFIIEVLENGASDRAGIRVGDVILRLNGQRFRHSGEADRIMKRAETHRALAYEILRDNRVLTLHVTLAKYSTSLSVFIAALVGLSFWGLALFIGLSRPQLKGARVLALALLALSFPVMMYGPPAPSTPNFFVASARLFFPLSMLLSFALLMHSSAYFPKERPELLQRKWILTTPYLIAGLAFVLSWLGLLPLPTGIFTLAAFNLYLYWRFRREHSAEHKKQSRVLKWTTILVALASLIVGASLFFYKLGEQFNGYALLPILLIPLAFLYTIGRYRVFDMNLRVGLNVQYLFISWLWGLLLLGGFLSVLFFLPQLPLAIPNFQMSGGVVQIVEAPLPAAQHLAAEKIILMLVAVGLVFLYRRFHHTVQAFLERRFYRAGYDYRRAVNELSEVMATQLSMLELAKGIARKLADHIQLKRVGVLFFRDQRECSCTEAHGFEENEWREFCVTIDRPLISALQKFRSESRFSTDYLPPALKEQFQRSGFVHILPIRFKEKLVGALLVGEKLSEAGFHEEDLHYLAAVAKQASLAIENAFLYEELAEKERMKHELAIARRIQLASLPQTTPRVPGLDIAGVSIPALEVGGDYFDYLNGKPDQITVIVGDVSGKGTSAALYMSKVQGILRSLHDFGLSPRELFIRANHLLRDALDRSSFVTSIGACFEADTKRLRLARAGHLPLYHYQARTGKVERVTPKGLGLGLDDDRLFAAELEERSLSYEAGDVFMFVTDGITEAQSNNGHEFGEDMLTEILGKSVAESAGGIRDRVINAVKSFTKDEQQHDDLTLVVVKAV